MCLANFGWVFPAVWSSCLRISLNCLERSMKNNILSGIEIKKICNVLKRLVAK